MYTFRKFCFIGLMLVTVFFAVAQQKDSIPKNTVKVLEVEAVPLDSLAMKTTGMEQTDLELVPSAVKDNSVSALSKTKKGFQLQDQLDAARYDSIWLNQLSETAVMYENMYDDISNLDIDKTYEHNLPTDTLKARLNRLNEKTPLNIEYNPSLENVIKSFLTRRRGLMEKMLTASQFYFPLFEEQLDKHDVPQEIKYLSIVESALNPKARSRVGATGLWQFMYGTGRELKLEVSSYVDERSDPIKSTEAACIYLKRLYSIYDDWDLALAAYNSGPGNVNKAIRRSGGYRNYWNIRNNLPRETAGYVPAFLATMYLMEYADEHDIKIKKAKRPYFETDTIHVKHMITFDQISELTGISVETIELMNPSYKLNIIPYVEGKNYTLRLPISEMGKFVANEEAIYAHVKKELKDKEKVLPQLVVAKDRIRYKVRSGDYLGKIAERYGVGVSQIKRWNGMRSNNLRVGQRLTIFPKKPVGSPNTKKPTTKVAVKLPSDKSKIHTVQSGDSLWTISRKYPGISIDNLRKWNGISGNNLKPGTKLKLCDCSS
ncbi:LysM peptidoglycan-binding domain-containing protein [Costertonia aggregata]|uniref:LysM peptidoglycan-binding domain-containing protein n=1 Tax=Costertonia aggregata TaxID=343403 RepID=A0A7H9APF0_9FLAO|nr:LysM peptidoglycan-binding domain-containing protein [Costertonia aggregata]QLG45263.1 LysM peptidoglycan-binding domain-containing protein [Costertonia aggregata]